MKEVLLLLLGILLGGLVKIVHDRYLTFKGAKAVACAFEGEISGLLDVTRRRRYVEELEKTISYLTELSREPTPDGLL
jgi:hypothetical protein